MNNEIKKSLESFYDENIWEHDTLGDFIKKLSDLYKDRIAIVDGERKISYEILNIEAERYAEGFSKYGFKPGDKIVLQLPNCLEFIVISFALFKIGVVPIMALTAQRKSEIRGILEKSEARGYIGKDKYLSFSYTEMIREVSKELSNDIKVFILGEPEEFNSLTSLKTNEWLTQRFDIDYKDIGLLLLSGGTTDIPKLIPRRHCDYLYVAKKMAEKCKLDENSIYLAALPMAHNFPLGCPGIIGTLKVGGRVIISQNTSPDEIIPLIEEERVTITSFVPAVANMCADFLEVDNEYDISSLKVIQIGGAVLDSSLARKFEDLFKCKLQQIYGIAEGLICCTSLDDKDTIVYTTQGKPISEYDEVLIVNEYGDEVLDGEYGELIVRGPYTIYAYLSLEKINETCISEKGYFYTGDKARKLKNGNYQVIGRIKEMINKAGEKIIPSELEKILLEHPSILDVQVVGIPDQFLGEKIGVFIIPHKNKLSLNDVRTYLIDKQIAHFKMPDQILYVNKWPLTNIGKINKNRLKEIALEQRGLTSEREQY